MSRIKIKNLPEITYDKIKNTDIMIVENKDDTFKSTIADMKKVFSCDSKILALQESLQSSLDELNDTINNNYTSTSEDIEDINNQLDAVNKNIKNIITRLQSAESNLKSNNDSIIAIKKSLSDSERRLDDFNLTQESQKQKINELDRKISNNLSSINSLRNTISEYENRLSDLSSKVQDISNAVSKNKELSDNNFDLLSKKIDDRYQELLEIIDYYHHHILQKISSPMVGSAGIEYGKVN